MSDAEPVRVRVLDHPLVWTLVRETTGPLGGMVELAAAGRRWVVPRSWVTRTDEPAAPLRQV